MDCTVGNYAQGRDPQQPMKVLVFFFSFIINSVFILYLICVSWRAYAGLLNALCLCAATYKAEFFTQTAVPLRISLLLMT